MINYEEQLVSLNFHHILCIVRSYCKTNVRTLIGLELKNLLRLALLFRHRGSFGGWVILIHLHLQQKIQIHLNFRQSLLNFPFNILNFLHSFLNLQY